MCGLHLQQSTALHSELHVPLGPLTPSGPPSLDGPNFPLVPHSHSRVHCGGLEASTPGDPLCVRCCPPGRFKVSEHYTHLRLRTSPPCLTRAIQTSLRMAANDILRDANWGCPELTAITMTQLCLCSHHDLQNLLSGIKHKMNQGLFPPC